MRILFKILSNIEESILHQVSIIQIASPSPWLTQAFSRAVLTTLLITSPRSLGDQEGRGRDASPLQVFVLHPHQAQHTPVAWGTPVLLNATA